MAHEQTTRERCAETPPKSCNARVSVLAAIAAVAVAAFLLGHYGWRLARPAAHLGVARADGGGAPVLKFGDAGSDAPDVPAPPGARREFAILSPSDPNRMIVRYRSEASAVDVTRFYSTAMARRGWRLMTHPRPAAMEEIGATLCYSNNTGTYCIIAITEADDGGTGVAVLRMRPSPAAREEGPT